jgi:hypothetical protein
LKAKVNACRIGRNCQVRFWCGLCNKLIDLMKKGAEAWTERFMGRRDFTKHGIQDWILI